uniref:Uncharacterized protein n=1 Tax=Bionectria ochroleuca TaxID=29856 RepID=A0A8H7N2H0_BIOOC
MSKETTSDSFHQMKKPTTPEAELTEQQCGMTHVSSKKREAKDNGNIQKPTTSGPRSENPDQNKDYLPLCEGETGAGSGQIESGVLGVHSQERGYSDRQQLKTDSPTSDHNREGVKRVGQATEAQSSGDPRNTVPLYSGEECTNELRHELEEMRQKDEEFRKVINKQRRKISKQDEKVCILLQEKASLESELRDIKLELKNARQDMLDNEAIVTKAHTMVVSNLASEVSSEFPDDMIKKKLEAFFQNDFLSWCSDLCVSEIEDPEKADKLIRSTGLLNDSELYNNAPGFMKFDVRSPDGAASLPLLQAALSATLCQHFLAFPYFLADLSSNTGSAVETQEALCWRAWRLLLVKHKLVQAWIGGSKLWRQWRRACR